MATKKKRKARRQRKIQNRNLLQASSLPSEIEFAVDSVDIEATVDSENNPGNPNVRMVAYTGGPLSLRMFRHPAVIQCSGVHAMDTNQLPMLRDHDQNRVVGHGTPVIEATQLRHEGTLSVPGEDRDTITAAQQNDFRWQASVGGRIPKPRRDVVTIPAGKSVRVNGRVFQGPIHVVKAFLWKETSFCAMGADEGRASADIAATSRVAPMNEFEQWLEASGVDSENLTDTQLANFREAYDALQASNDPPVAPPAATPPVDVASITNTVLEASRQQNQRERRINRLFATYTETGLSDDRISELRASAEDGSLSEEAVHLELLQATRSNGQASNVHGSDARVGRDTPISLEASLYLQAGISEEEVSRDLVAAGFSEPQAAEAIEQGRRAPRGLKALIQAVCYQEGVRAYDVDDDAIRCAMHAAQRDFDPSDTLNATSGFSSVRIPGILSRLANKAMLAAYAEADNGGVATTIASVTSTRDFKKFSRYRMTESGVMDVVPATGEIKHGHLSEEAYENQVDTYGKILSLSRQMIRNDDLDAFLQIPRMIGRMGRHSLEQATIDTLVNAPSNAAAGTTEFFHGAIRGNQEPNYQTGAGTALGMDSLEAAYTLFLNQVDADGKPIMIDPALLLCTNADIVMARKLYTDTQYRFTVADTTELINNQWQGMFEPVKSAYLHRRGTTPSSTQWYLLSRPTIDVSGIQIAFLDGQRTPTINQSETSFNTLGLQMRGYFDFGVALQDPRAIVKSDGA